MNSISKLIIAATATLLMQSCNMSKHYANMRIDHDDEQIQVSKQTSARQVEKNPGFETASSPVCKTDSIVEPCVASCDTVSFTRAENNKLKRISLTSIKTHSPVAKKTIIKKFRNSVPKRKLIKSAAKYIDIDDEKTHVVILLVVAGLTALLSALGVFGATGTIILGVLAVVAVIGVVAIGFCLLIAGFLAMCGMNLFY